jgi:uncharacterized repeat protein (TIGR01451 family)
MFGCAGQTTCEHRPDWPLSIREEPGCCDVVLMQAAGVFRVHRTMGIDERDKMIITRGDAMRENDRDPARFMGRLIAIERNHLAIRDRGRTPSPFFALIRPSVRALLRWIRKTGWGSLIAVALLALGAGLMAEPAAAQADLGVTHTASAAVVAAGTNVTYTATVTNSGPNASLNAITHMNIPANTTFQSGTVPTATGWTCTLPPVNSTTPITCNNPSFASGATSIFTFTVQYPSGNSCRNIDTKRHQRHLEYDQRPRRHQ